MSIAAKLVADLLSTAGVDRVICMDLHADQIQGFFNVPVDHLYASSVFIPYIKSLHLENMVIATPDVGGAKRANNYAKYFDVPLVLCHKQRAKANVVASMTVIGDVKGKNVILIDDMVDTAGTITKAADLMMAEGAEERPRSRFPCDHERSGKPACRRQHDGRDYIHQQYSLYRRLQEMHNPFGCETVCRHYPSSSRKSVNFVTISYINRHFCQLCHIRARHMAGSLHYFTFIRSNSVNCALLSIK